MRTALAALAEALALRGVRRAFGMPGGDVLPLLDALRAVGIEFILTREEAAAGFMAAATAELDGAPGLAISTLGPGATRLLSGAAGAQLERTRALFITGQCSPRLRGRYTHQILDQQALFAPVCRSTSALGAPGGLRAALDALDLGPPGAVHLDLAGSQAEAQTDEDVSIRVAEHRRDAQAEAEAARLLARSERPVVLIGHDERSDEVCAALRALVEALGAPALVTYRAKGLIDEQSPRFAGAFGLSPVVDAHQQALIAEADLIVAVGLDPVELRPEWLPGWPAHLPVLSLSENPQPDVVAACTLVGDLAGTLARLCPAPRAPWRPLDAHRAAILAPFDDGPDGPAAAIRAVVAALPEDTVLALDVGAHRITASQVWPSRQPRRLLQSNGLSSMGTGLPYALAAALTGRPAAVISGDMGLWMCLGELGLAQERRLNLVVLYLSDAALSLIALKQERSRLPTQGVTFENPDVCALAAAFGGAGRQVRGATAVEVAVRSAVEAGGLQIIEVLIDPAPYRRQM